LKGNIKLSEALKGNINAAGSKRTKEVRALIRKSIERNTNRAKAVFVYSSVFSDIHPTFLPLGGTPKGGMLVFPPQGWGGKQIGKN